MQPALVQMDALHPPSAAENLEDLAASAGPAQTEGHVWSYSWVEVLWKLGLTHKNPMVRADLERHACLFYCLLTDNIRLFAPELSLDMLLVYWSKFDGQWFLQSLVGLSAAGFCTGGEVGGASSL